jgi:hypothetical protein
MNLSTVLNRQHVAKEDVDSRMTPREVCSRSLSRNPSSREELAKSKDKRRHHRHPHRTWLM